MVRGWRPVTQTNQSRTATTYDPATLAVNTETISYDLDHDGSYPYTRVLDRKQDSLLRATGSIHTVINQWQPNRDVLATKQNKADSCAKSMGGSGF